MGCIITYQKANGDILLRRTKSEYDLYIGKETSMGWKVLDIHYEFEGNYYHKQDYFRIVRKSRRTTKQKIADYVMHKANAWR